MHEDLGVLAGVEFIERVCASRAAQDAGVLAPFKGRARWLLAMLGASATIVAMPQK